MSRFSHTLRSGEFVDRYHPVDSHECVGYTTPVQRYYSTDYHDFAPTLPVERYLTDSHECMRYTISVERYHPADSHECVGYTTPVQRYYSTDYHDFAPTLPVERYLTDSMSA
ncbi:hypothetical protein TNIN_386011 [Trichonephila inaurata madagascariensis]|uniref:Uncharacterized protein n=1 Tax=Trichonephila inaurata madagascariensis TaxID=2747483 RepID=A0A8X7CBE5_9ARAC|nr:hypothetical protein TNIN_386011 [Trichonephila inaurata madagascariensis]